MTTLAERAEAEGVLICQLPVVRGPSKGSPSAQGTPMGYTRHRAVGDFCDPCREAHNAYVRQWLRAKRESESDRRVHAVLSDGTEVVRYDRAGKWYLEKGDVRQKVTLDAAARASLADAEAQVRLGISGGKAFDAKVS